MERKTYLEGGNRRTNEGRKAGGLGTIFIVSLFLVTNFGLSVTPAICQGLDKTPASTVVLGTPPTPAEISEHEALKQAQYLERVADLEGVGEATASQSANPRPESQTAACSYTTLLSGVSMTATSPLTDYQYTQNSIYWCAAAVRPASGDDWDLRVFDATAPDPTCLTTLRASSIAFTGVDFVIGDYNVNPLGTDYVRVNRFSGTQSATVEWDDGADQILVNGPTVQRSTGATDVIEVWDVYFNKDTTYTFNFNPAGAADLKLMLFGRSAQDSIYWVPRTARLFEVNTNTQVQFTASQDAWYGVVVVNDNGQNGSYSLAIGRCVPPIPLVSGSSLYVPPAFGYFRVNQAAPRWAAMGFRSTAPGTDWNLPAYLYGGGGQWPTCFAGSAAFSSVPAGDVDFVVVDYNLTPLDTLFLHPKLEFGTAGGFMEYEEAVPLVVDGPPVYANGTSQDVLAIWEVALEAGVTYTLTPVGDVMTTINVFKNTTGGAYYAPRIDAELVSPEPINYTPTATGFYAIVADNPGGESGTYGVQIETATCPTTDLVSGVSVVTHMDAIEDFDFYRCPQAQPHFAAAGARVLTLNGARIRGFQTDDLGGPVPDCATGPIADSSGGRFAFVVGDFHENVVAPFLIKASIDALGMPFPDSLRVEWEGGANILTVGAPPISQWADQANVLDVWDVFLSAGATYDIHFAPNFTGTRLHLYRSTTSPSWQSRSSAELVTFGDSSYTAPTTDWYGIVVAKNSEVAGAYEVGITLSDVAVGEHHSGSTLTALLTAAPNPTGGAAQIRFQLERAAEVGFDIVDASGRVVASLPRRIWSAGMGSTSWDGRNTRGARAAAGVYWVRMSADGREIGRTKIVLLS